MRIVHRNRDRAVRAHSVGILLDWLNSIVSVFRFQLLRKLDFRCSDDCGCEKIRQTSLKIVMKMIEEINLPDVDGLSGNSSI